MSFIIKALQTLLFVGLLPVYSLIYLEAFNKLEGLVMPISLSLKLSIAIDHWRYLDFGRPFEALFAISASSTTVFVVSIVAWWYL